MGLEEQTKKTTTSHLMRKTDGSNWPLYKFEVDGEGRVVYVELIFNLGARQVYEKVPDTDLIVSYRKGRFGTHKLPAEQYVGMGAIAYTNARERKAGPEDSSPEFQASNHKLISLSDISDIIARDAFSKENTAQNLFEQYKLLLIESGRVCHRGSIRY